MNTDLFSRVMAVADANPCGFAVYVEDCLPILFGWVIEIWETRCQPLESVIDYARRTTGLIKGWRENGQKYFAVIHVVKTLAEVRALAIANRQTEVFCLHHQRVYFLS
jgi:hypothetical protein